MSDELRNISDSLRRDVLSAIQHLAGMETWLLHDDHLSQAELSLRNAGLSLQRIEARLADRRAWVSNGGSDGQAAS